MGVVDFTAENRKSKRFYGAFERIRDDVLVHMTHTMPTEAVEWLRSNLDFNVSDSALDSIMSVMDFVEILRGRALSDDEYFKAASLEWCIKLLQASRPQIYSGDKPNRHRKQQCWYAGDDAVIQDSLVLGGVMYYLLKKHFHNEAYYAHLLELFQDTTFLTGTGQMVNLITAPKGRVDLSKFSISRHAMITRRKVTSFYLPVAAAMCVCGVPESYAMRGHMFFPYATARSILLQLGEYFQVQEDFLGYVGTVGKVSKTRSDIMENKCSWCINVALVVSSPGERRVLEENYGGADPEEEKRVMQIYETIGLREQYRAYEASLKEQIEALIRQVPEPEENVEGCVLRREIFSRFFNEIYKRSE